MNTTANAARTERRVKKVRPGYLNPDVMNRAADNAEARLYARLRKTQPE